MKCALCHKEIAVEQSPMSSVQHVTVIRDGKRQELCVGCWCEHIDQMKMTVNGWEFSNSVGKKAKADA